MQIRNLDDHAYTVLRTRAAAENLSLSAYLRRELERMASRPSMAELLARADSRRAVASVSTEDIVNALHAGRDERGQQLWPTS